MTSLAEYPAAIVTVALREAGVREATGRNDGVPSRRYQRDPYVEGQLCREVSWCALFVMWVFDQLEGPRLHHSRAQWYQRAAVSALWSAWTGCEVDDPEPGDIIVLNDRGESDPSIGGWHCGIIICVTEDRVVSVDGNWRNRVDVVCRERDLDKIVGYLRIR